MKELDAMNIMPHSEDGYVQIELIYKLEGREWATESEVIKCDRPTLAGLAEYMKGEGMAMFETNLDDWANIGEVGGK